MYQRVCWLHPTLLLLLIKGDNLVQEDVIRPQIAKYKCGCSKVGGPYKFIRVGDKEHICPKCGKVLSMVEVIHKAVVYRRDEDGLLII